MTRLEFINSIRNKYPQYNNIDDNTLFNKIIEKYPVYKNQITDFTTPQPQVKQPVVESNFKKIELSHSHIEHIRGLNEDKNTFELVFFILLVFLILFNILRKVIKLHLSNKSIKNE